MGFKLRNLNTIFIGPILALALVAGVNWFMQKQVTTVLADFITDRKAVNARQAADRLSHQLQLPIPEIERFSRMQRTLDLSFDNTAALLVKRAMNRRGIPYFETIAFSDFDRQGQGSVFIKNRPVFAYAERLALNRQGSINHDYQIEGVNYHLSTRALYDDPGRSEYQVWLITDIDDAISPVVNAVNMGIAWSIVLQIFILGAFAVVAIQPLWMLKYFLGKGVLFELPFWAPYEVKNVRSAIAAYQKELVAQKKEAIEARQVAEEYAEEIENVNHISAHDVKADVIAASKGGEVIVETLEEIRDYLKDKGIEDETIADNLDFMTTYAGRIVKSCSNAYDVIDQRNKLSNLKEKLEIQPWSVDDIYENIAPMANSQDGKFLYKNKVDGVKPLCDLVFFTAALKNIIRNGFVHNDSFEKIVNLSVYNSVDGVVYFEVSDNGVGMPDEYLKSWGKIQGKAAQLGNRGGSGTGLYSIRKTVEAHGGEAVVRSRIDLGTTFSVRIKGEKL